MKWNTGFKNKKTIMLLLFLLMSILISGCGNKEQGENSESGAANEFTVYYLDTSKSALATEQYLAQADMEDTSSIVDELVEAMSKPNVTAEHISAIPDAITKLDRKLADNVLSVYFSDAYNTLSASEEVMFRAAYVKTVTQVPGIKYVCFYVNDQPLMDAMGNTVGIMLASDFVEDTATGVNSLSWVDLSIYYANEAGDKLVPEKINVGYGRNASIERVIIEQLIKGPGEDGHQRTVSETLTLLSVSTKDGICNLNFDTSFINTLTGVSADITIYSIVNSLCELSNINKVQISVNGVNNHIFRDTIDLSVPLERNLDLVEAEQ